MFSQLFFLILALMIINLAGVAPPTSADVAFFNLLEGIIIYTATLFLIVVQNLLFAKKESKHAALTILANMDLCTCLILLVALTPIIQSSSLFLTSLVYLVLYFLGLMTHYLFHAPRSLNSPKIFALRQIRFYFPFVIPFLLLNGLYDLSEIFSWEHLSRFLIGNAEGFAEFLTLLFGSALLLFLLIAFFPPLLLKIWGCYNMEESSMKECLEALCKRANFKHGGLKIWSIMKDSYTAAIIGIIPKLRFVMFTNKLLRDCPSEYTEAILCHEIGHSQRRHLFIYPFVLLGMMLSGAILALLFGEGLLNYIAYKKMLSPSELWQILEPFIIFVPYAAFLFLYFRFVFGFFSRKFERQADLHIYEHGIAPEHMIGALDFIGTITGNSHKKPSWHHFSIWERMEFLKKTITSPYLITKHHKNVRICLFVYVLFLVALMLIFSAPYLSKNTFFGSINQKTSAISQGFDYFLNGNAQDKIIDKFLKGSPFLKKDDSSRLLIKESLRHPGALSSEGLLAFYAAQYLVQSGNPKESLLMMHKAWEQTNFSHYPRSVRQKFLTVSKQLIENTSQGPYHKERRKLMHLIKRKMRPSNTGYPTSFLSQEKLEIIL